MISDRLYELAFEYKKTKLWKILWDTEMFGVALSGGRIGYISIMGMAGEHCALGMYIGEEGAGSLRSILEADKLYLGPFEAQEMMLKQDCLQCAFEGKEDLSKEELEEARAYARANGIRISGKNAYPHFLKNEPGRYPWHLQAQEEQEDLCEGLSAAIELSRLLEGKMPSQLGLHSVDGIGAEEEIEIPLLEQQAGGYVLKKTMLPPAQEISWPVPVNCNEIGIASLKKLKKSCSWECEIIMFPEPVQSDPEDAPVFPYIFMMVDPDRNYILPVPPVERYLDAPEDLLNLLIEALLQEGTCPRKMKARDERTYGFLENFCKRLKIPLEIEPDLPALDEVEMEFLRHSAMDEGEEMEELIGIIGEMMQEEGLSTKDLPPELLEQLEMILEQEDLPEEIRREMNRIFYPEKKPRLGKEDFKTVKPKSNRSYVISVSLGTGCYRHIQISGSSTLWELHCAVLDVFAFDDDHAHAFFMDNRRWSEWDCYYARGIEEGCRSTEDYTLDQAGLCKGKKFLYLFDFGDEWTFQCKVLREVEGGTDVPMVIKEKGKAPEQYPDW